MSNLRDRLKSIAQKAPQEAAASPPPECRVVESWHETPGADSIPPDILRLFLGEEGGKRLLFLDTETTGLGTGAGTVAFMVGIGVLRPGGQLLVRQYTMRDYDEEEDLLQRLLGDLAEADALVTYNGKSFDAPLLRSRLAMHRLRPSPLELPHIDLLHIARRVYKKRLKRCTLGDMEREVLGIFRQGDLPGALAPEYWFRFLKEGDMALIEEIERHNRQDIASLALLLKSLADAYTRPEMLSHQEDLFSVGKAMERLGEEGRARMYYQAAGQRSEALLALARIHRRNARPEDAIPLLQQAAELGGTEAVYAMVELSKLYEHRIRQYPEALRWVDEALIRCTGGEVDALLRRRARIRRKWQAQREREGTHARGVE